MKIMIMIGLLFLLLPGVKGQETHFGVKGGISISSLHLGEGNLESKLGLNAGAFAHIHASQKWALQPELLFSTEGATARPGANNERKIYSLDYFNIPVLLQYMFRNGLRLEGGPQLGLLLSAKEKMENTITNRKSSYQKVSVSLPLGISFLTRQGIGLDARYVFGLSNINEATDPVIQSNVFQFGIFFQRDSWRK